MRKIAFFFEWRGYHGWVDECPLYEKVKSLAGLGRLSISSYKPEDIMKLKDSSGTIYDFWSKNDIADYKDLVYRDLYLWELCKCSVYDHLIKCSIDSAPDYQVVRQYYDKVIHLIDCFDLFYKKKSPDAIAVVQGAHYDMRSAVEVARWHGIETIAIENSFIRQLVFIDKTSGTICNRHALSRNSWDRIKARRLTSVQEQRLYDFFGRTFKSQIAQDNSMSEEEIRNRLNIGRDKKIALVVGQVATDAVICIDSYVYKNIAEFMLDIAGAMEKHPDYHVIIRLHPREAFRHTIMTKEKTGNITLKRLKEMGIDQYKNVSIVHSHDINTYSIMEFTDLGIAINSQVGLEILFRKKPVVVLGDAFYSRKGFTWDVNYKEVLPLILDKAVRNPVLTDRQKRDIDNFLYHMVFEYLFPRDLQGCNERLHKLFLG